jgi:hypothetical protein
MAWAHTHTLPPIIVSPGRGLTQTPSPPSVFPQVDPNAIGWSPLLIHTHAVHQLIEGLMDLEARLCPQGVGSRMRPMVARYSRGAGFARHTDNHCHQGKGPHWCV